MEWLTQALQRQEERRKAYLSQMAANNEIALDDPRMAGVNPGIDQMIAEVAAQQNGGLPPAPMAQAAIPDAIAGATQLQAPAQRNPRMPMSNLVSDAGTALMNAFSGMNTLAMSPEFAARLAAQQAGQMPASNPQPVQAGGAQFPPTPDVAQALAQPMPAPVQTAAPVPETTSQSEQSIIAQLEQAARPMPEALPQSYDTTLAEVLSNGQSTQAQDGLNGSSGMGTGAQKTGLLDMLGDPRLARMLIRAGSVMSSGRSFGEGLDEAFTLKDQMDTAKANAPYESRKREMELAKTQSEIIKAIADAGNATAGGRKLDAEAGNTKVLTSLEGYKTQTDRIKADAQALSAQAAFKQADTEVKKLLKEATGGKPISDKDWANLNTGIVQAIGENPIIQQQLQAQGMDAQQYATLTANSVIKDEGNKRYIPLPPTTVAELKQEYQRLQALPDTPEAQKEILQFKNRIQTYQNIYGSDALTQAIRN